MHHFHYVLLFLLNYYLFPIIFMKLILKNQSWTDRVINRWPEILLAPSSRQQFQLLINE